MSKAKDAPAEAVKDTGTASHMDGRGRLIVVKELNALDYYRVAKAMGGSSAGNEETRGLAMLACAVRKIDTVEFAIPTSERDVEFIIQQLDFDGIAAAGIALAKLAKDEEKVKAEIDAAKN